MTEQQLPPRPGDEPLASVQARPRRRLRTALLAGGVALALSGAGTAAVFAVSEPATAESRTTTESGTTTESRTSAVATGGSGHSHEGHRRQVGLGLRSALHGEFVMERDGSTVTMVIQRGVIEAVSETSITVKSTDGFSQEYTLNPDTEIRKLTEPAADGTFQRPADATAADLAVGDKVHIAGTKDGDAVTAVHVIAGDLPRLRGGDFPKPGAMRGEFDGPRGHDVPRGHDGPQGDVPRL